MALSSMNSGVMIAWNGTIIVTRIRAKASVAPRIRNLAKPYPAAVATRAVRAAAESDTTTLLTTARPMVPKLVRLWKLPKVRSKKVAPSGGAVMTALGCTERIRAHSSGTTNTMRASTSAVTYRTRLVPASGRSPWAVAGASACPAGVITAVAIAGSSDRWDPHARGGSVLVAQQPELAGADEADDDHQHDRQRGR